MDFDWNWLGAELSFQKAIELNPNYAAAHQIYGTLLLRLGRIGDAILELKKAGLLDPLSPAINTWMAEAFGQLGQHEAAIRLHKETIRFAPDYLYAYYFLVQSYVSTGQFPEAAKAAEDAVALSDDMSLTRSASIFLKAHMGDREAARTELQGLIEKRDKKYVSAINIASGFAVLKETDQVFKWLQIAHDERDSNLTWLNVDREFEYLHDDPRFRAMVRKVNLPDATNSTSHVLSEDQISGSESNTDEVRRPLPRPKRRFPTLAFVAAAVIVLGFVGLYLSRFAGAGSAKPEKNTLIKLTDGPFNDAYPTFTHDGRIRFSRFVDKQTLVTYVMNADGTGVSEQSEIAGLTSGFFSPDGTKVFFHRAPGDRKFYLANTDGSNEQLMPFLPGNCLWSPDSKQLAYQSKSSDNSTPNNSDIFIYTLETGTSVPVVESPFFDADPAFAPDGKSILYVSDVEGNFEVYSRVIATGATKRLTHNLAHDSFPTYSPDGTQIIFNSDIEKENTDVYLMNADGSNMRKITDAPGWDAAPANSWSPDGTQVLVLSDRGGKENVYLMNIEPYAPKRVGQYIDSDQPLDPAYSPDGRRVAYQLPGEISVFDIEAGTSRPVIKTSAGANPMFSPDGQKILFQERIEENTEVCQVNVDGSGFVNLTNSSFRDMSPAYSPDGARIAFSSNRASGTSTFEIYVMNADGTDSKLVFGDHAMSVGPAWSADGKSIVFANDREDGRIGNFELFSLNLDGGVEKRLTNRIRYDSDASVSPDGKHIAFVSDSDGNPEIYLMNAHGGGFVRLTCDLGNDLHPHWSPDGRKLIFTSNRTGKYGLYEIEL